jgi:hypothetical protein
MKYTKEYLEEYCEFSEEHKTLVWKKRPSHRAVIGQPIGSLTKGGYWRCKNQLVHRLIWLMYKGELPEQDIDHINGIRHDNRLENLREVSRMRNLWNRRNVKGYIFNPNTKKYQVRIRHNYKQIHIGVFDTAEEATEAYMKAKHERDNG